MVKTKPDSDTIFSSVCNHFPEKEGFECCLFKIGTYNAVVEDSYRLPYAENTLTILIMNTPCFFETTFKKWLQLQKREEEDFDRFVERFGCNPINTFFAEKFKKVQKELLPVKSTVVHDYEFTSEGKPRIIMASCGHVAGAAYFYRPRFEIFNKNITKNGLNVPTAPIRPMGLSLHRKYGGHFAYRGIIIFPEIYLPDTFCEAKPKMVLDTDEKQREALELFNFYWQDGRFRDCGCSGERYSDLQKAYYSVPPVERWVLIKSWFC